MKCGMIEVWAKWRAINPDMLEGKTPPRDSKVIEAEKVLLIEEERSLCKTLPDVSYIEGEPVYLYTYKTYINIETDQVIKPSGKQQKLSYFLGNQCDGKTSIEVDENGVPTEMVTLVQTCQKAREVLLVGVHRKILVDVSKPEDLNQK